MTKGEVANRAASTHTTQHTQAAPAKKYVVSHAGLGCVLQQVCAGCGCVPPPRTWVAPQQVTHGAVMRHLLLAVNGADLQQQQHASGTNPWQQKSGAAKAPAVALQQRLLSGLQTHPPAMHPHTTCRHAQTQTQPSHAHRHRLRDSQLRQGCASPRLQPPMLPHASPHASPHVCQRPRGQLPSAAISPGPVC